MWQPSAELSTLRARARLLADIRAFFAARGVMEVDPPQLGASTVTDPHLAALTLPYQQRDYFLQTSPEFFMKRLLAAGSGAIYSLGKAFRRDESGRRHNPEFTLLEWYRPGFDADQLIDEVFALVQALVPGEAVARLSYREAFQRHVGVNPHRASAAELAEAARGRLDIAWEQGSKANWLDLLFSHLVEPQLQQAVVVDDFPACQCALARVAGNAEGEPVAKRFELYWRGVELANGYWELTDAAEQRRRFDADLAQRKALGLALPAVDEKFLAALDAGLPDCAGVALGVDRLLMCLLNKTAIEQVLPFAFARL